MAEYRIPLPTTKEAAIFSVLIMAAALRTTLKQLAEMHDWKAGAWFDDLAGELVTMARGASSDMPMTIEAEGVGIGLQTLEALLQTVRNSLI
jgi:hypothetical protein